MPPLPITISRSPPSEEGAPTRDLSQVSRSLPAPLQTMNRRVAPRGLARCEDATDAGTKFEPLRYLKGRRLVGSVSPDAAATVPIPATRTGSIALNTAIAVPVQATWASPVAANTPVAIPIPTRRALLHQFDAVRARSRSSERRERLSGDRLNKQSEDQEAHAG